MKCKRLVCLWLVLVIMLLSLSACGDKGEPVNVVPNPPVEDEEPISQKEDPDDYVSEGSVVQNNEYFVSVKNAGGMPMAELFVYVYEDVSLNKLLRFTQTDENGEAQFSLDYSDKYAVVVKGVPEGYKVEESYVFEDRIANVVLTSSVKKGVDFTTASLKLGDVMPDFTITSTDGTEYTLSEVLKTKKMVLLNFWHNYDILAAEMQYMEEVYQQYKSKGEILAVTPSNDTSAIKAYKKKNSLSFPMAQMPGTWTNAFNIQGYPTKVVIDRYGVICLIEAGTITSKRPFEEIFKHFATDNYEQKIFNSVNDLVTDQKTIVANETSEYLFATLTTPFAPIKFSNVKGEGAEFTWPFTVTIKDGKKAVKASNSGVDASYAILIAEVTLKKGMSLALDCLVSSEKNKDILYIIVDDEPVYEISGTNTEWKTYYPIKATKDGAYNVVISYIKSDDGAAGEDTAYIRNFRITEDT